jgi:hypothetical protein
LPNFILHGAAPLAHHPRMNHHQISIRTASMAASEVGAADPSIAMAKAYEFHGAVNALFSILKEAGRDFAQDYKAWVIFNAFLVASAADTLRDAAASKRVQDYAPGLLSAQSVSEMTGIPRETVRRKCQALMDRGLLSLDGSGMFRLDVDSETAESLSSRFGKINPLSLVIENAAPAKSRPYL